MNGWVTASGINCWTIPSFGGHIKQVESINKIYASVFCLTLLHLHILQGFKIGSKEVASAAYVDSPIDNVHYVNESTATSMLFVDNETTWHFDSLSQSKQFRTFLLASSSILNGIERYRHYLQPETKLTKVYLFTGLNKIFFVSFFWSIKDQSRIKK